MKFALAFIVIAFGIVVTSVQAKEAARSSSSRRSAAPIAATPNVDEAKDKQDLKEIAAYYINDALLKTQDMQPTCFECDPSQPGAPSKACRDHYTDLYSRDTVDFRFLFGYMDQYNAEDVAAREAAVEQLMKPCGGWVQGACGFTYESDDDLEVLVKTMKGPDGREKTVRLTIANSAVSTNLTKNRGPMAALQARQSEHVRRLFEDGLRNSDMTIYVGHGRDGGGPSFEPPRLRANGETDFTWYNRHPDSRQNMMRALRGATHPPKLVGMFACYSERYFIEGNPTRRGYIEGIRNASPQTGAVGSTGFTSFEALYSQSFGMLDAVLSMRCERQFEQSIHALKEVSNNPTLPPARQLPPTIRGVWDRRIAPQTSRPVMSAPDIRPVVAEPAPAPVVEEEPIPTGETVRRPRAPVLLSSPPITPDGSQPARSQPRSTMPQDGAR